MQEKGTDVPVFVARDLQKLPPVSFDSLDVSCLLSQIKKTQSELDLLKDSMTAQQCAVQSLTEVVGQVKLQTDRIVSNQSTTAVTASDIVGATSVPVVTVASTADATNTTSISTSTAATDITTAQAATATAADAGTRSQHATEAAHDSRNASSSLINSSPRNKVKLRRGDTSYADVVSSTARREEEDWLTVRRVNGKLKPVPVTKNETTASPSASPSIAVGRETKESTGSVTGAAKNTGLLTVDSRSHRRAHIFVSRFHSSVSSEMAKTFLVEKLGSDSDIRVESVQTRYDTYRSFRVSCRCKEPNTLMQPDLWPENTYVRRWRGPIINAQNRANSSPNSSS